MGLQIIIKSKNKWKGKYVSEMAKNLESEGWPKEVSEEQLDKMSFLERKLGRALKPEDIGRRPRRKE